MQATVLTAMAEWVDHLCSEWEIPCSNPGILPLLSSACREPDGPPCHIHAYTVYTPIGRKGRCRTICDLQDHCKQERVQVRSTLDLKPMRKDTQSPKQEQSVAPRNGPWSNKNFNKKNCVWLTPEKNTEKLPLRRNTASSGGGNFGAQEVYILYLLCVVLTFPEWI